jgi:hypothetical protein
MAPPRSRKECKGYEIKNATTKYIGRKHMNDFEPSKIEHRFLRRAKLTNRKHVPTCISLFSGCGGMDLGFRQAGVLSWQAG